jgi:hypothetical protein
MCHDCAYRKDSPERNGEEGFQGDEEELFHIVATGKKFYCHQGVRKIVKYRHPSGMEIDAHPADYNWRLVTKDGETFPIKADGSAADICGGWCKNRRKFLASKADAESEEVESFSSYPNWICYECGNRIAKHPLPNRLSCFHNGSGKDGDVCGWCGGTGSLTQPRDYGYPQYPEVKK